MSTKAEELEGGDDPQAEEEVIVIDKPTEKETPPPGKQSRVFTEEEVERIRQEEKAKLYRDQEKLREQLKVLTDEAEERKKTAEKAAKDAEKAAKDAEAAEQKRKEEEMSAKELIDAREAEWQARFTQMQDNLAVRDAQLEKEREYSALQLYRQQVIAEHEEEIMPELRDMVGGYSQEEIDQSVALMVEKTASILDQASNAVQQQRQQMRTVAPNAPAAGPMEAQEQERLTAEDLKNMPMADYAKRRSQLLRGGASNQRGLFG